VNGFTSEGPLDDDPVHVSADAPRPNVTACPRAFGGVNDRPVKPGDNQVSKRSHERAS
jgi:hypothetical protein